MKKLIYPVFVSYFILTILINGCVPAQTALPASPTPIPPTPTATPKPNPEPMSISILPFYDYQGTQINVGDYSERLKADDIQILAALAKEMAQQRDVLTPEQMYVLAIRLYDLGDKDNSIYWYYEAQFRARLFQQAIEPAQYVSVSDQTFKLNTAYDDFQRMAGEYVNGYAGCDLENWVKFAQMVVDDNLVPPALDQMFPDVVFVTQDRWQAINNEVAAGLAKLIEYISNNGESIKQQRAQQDMDKYCK